MWNIWIFFHNFHILPHGCPTSELFGKPGFEKLLKNHLNFTSENMENDAENVKKNHEKCALNGTKLAEKTPQIREPFLVFFFHSYGAL